MGRLLPQCHFLKVSFPTMTTMPKIFPSLQLPVAPSANDPRPLVLYHGRNCPDGFGAALAAWRFFGDAASYRGIDHGEIASVADLGADFAGRTLYVLDIALDAAVLAEAEELAHRIIILDHHESAARKLGGWQCRCGVVHFDLEKSGARLAWEFFHPTQPVPAMFLYIEDRDLWRWQYAESAHFLAALDFEPRSFERWWAIAQMDDAARAAFTARGAAMEEKFQQLVRDIAADAQPVRLAGVEGLMVNAPSIFHSAIGDILARQCGTFGLMWQARGGQIKVGLRSRENFRCVDLAEQFGGGGHAQACGFRISAAQLGQLLAGDLPAPASTSAPIAAMQHAAE